MTFGDFWGYLSSKFYGTSRPTSLELPDPSNARTTDDILSGVPLGTLVVVDGPCDKILETFYQKWNGTESQRTPFSKLRSSYKILRFRGPFRNGPVGYFLETWNRKKPTSCSTK